MMGVDDFPAQFGKQGQGGILLGFFGIRIAVVHLPSSPMLADTLGRLFERWFLAAIIVPVLVQVPTDTRFGVVTGIERPELVFRRL